MRLEKIFPRPLDIGTFNSDFSIVAGVEYFSSYMMDYRDDPFLWDEYCDMVHEFTITEPMVVTMDDEGSDNFGENDYRSVLMSSRTDTVQAVFSETFGWGYTRCRYELAPGRYFIYSFGKAPRNPNELVINLTGKTCGLVLMLIILLISLMIPRMASFIMRIRFDTSTL